MKSEKGVTLTILIIYIIVFSIVIGMLASLSNYIYGNLGNVNDSSIKISEFGKFNTRFVEDVKTSIDAEVKTNTDGNLQISFSNGNVYVYSKKSIYRNKEKIAKDIDTFTATLQQGNGKKYINVNIKISSNDGKNYTRQINYVLKYW